MENLEKDEKNLDAKIEKRKAALEISEKRLSSLEVRSPSRFDSPSRSAPYPGPLSPISESQASNRAQETFGTVVSNQDASPIYTYLLPTAVRVDALACSLTKARLCGPYRACARPTWTSTRSSRRTCSTSTSCTSSASGTCR